MKTAKSLSGLPDSEQGLEARNYEHCELESFTFVIYFKPFA
jgi:hypothetical protein